jgi:hypothetical protein
MTAAELAIEKKVSLPDTIGIYSYLDHDTGEYNFVVFSGKRYVKAKSLYDALSIFGIEYEVAKSIVKSFDSEIDSMSQVKTKVGHFTKKFFDPVYNKLNERFLRLSR